MKAEVARKILELDFRRWITIVCFLFAAQGVRTWALADIAELSRRLFRSLLWLLLRRRIVMRSRLCSMFASDVAALAAAVSFDRETVSAERGGTAAQFSGQRARRPEAAMSPRFRNRRCSIAFRRSISVIQSACRTGHSK
jgi:hypothetical protein